MFEFVCKYVKSSCCVEVKTLFPEKLLNRLQGSGIAIWNIKKNDITLVFSCLKQDIDEIERLSSNFCHDFAVISENGLPKIKKAVYQKRVLLACFVLCIAALLFLSSRIWKINIYSLRKTEPGVVIDYLYSVGVRQSMRISSLDEKKLRTDLLTAFDDFSDVEIERKGTELNITVKEKKSVVVSYDKKLAVNIVATEDALVDSVEVFNGTALVSAGDYVKKGDVLISGEIDVEDSVDGEVKRNVHAMGNVCAYNKEIFTDIYIHMYTPNEGAEYSSDKYIKLGQRTFMVGKKVNSENTVPFESHDNNIHIAWFEIPVLYDEIKWYNINDCTLKDEYEISLEIYSEVESRIPDAELIDLVYSAEPYDNYTLKINAEAEYLYNIGTEELIE